MYYKYIIHLFNKSNKLKGLIILRLENFIKIKLSHQMFIPEKN